ncbi:S-layer homology domain-containing protein [Paenibacillus sp. 1_12]|uniref:S-layer homology domain-containing protein n=1 Tax=Paenibacillus sp. 1_12 TaxID=1566278 RepID=UPI0008EAEB72|nr:S-layer homology domain-containing protein [Paenibacillus sp. 1_12]SFL16466.1 S-layer homology domain-containing protein [Paenibacillus sp. 1_12]
MIGRKIRKNISMVLCLAMLFMLLPQIQSVSAVTLNTTNEWFEDFENFPTSTAFGTSGNGDLQYGWKSNSGTNPWTIAKDTSSNSNVLRANNTGISTVFIGGTGSYVFDATDVMVSADVKVVTTSSTGQIGINARQNSNNDFYALVIKNGELQLLKRVGGTTQAAPLAQKTIPNFTLNKYYTLTLLVKGSTLIGSISGGPTIVATDTAITAPTKVGVNVNLTIDAYVDNFHAMKVFPNAPTGLSVISAVDNQINLKWSGAASAEKYTVKRSTTPGGPYSTIATVTSGVYTDSNVPSGTYYYVVGSVAKASNGDNIDGALSSEISVTPQASTQIPGVPTNLRIAPGEGQAVLSWDPVGQITGYKIKRSMVSGNFSNQDTVVKSVYPTVTNFMDTGLSIGSTYHYVVSAVNVRGESQNSSQVSVFIAPALEAPKGLTAIPGFNLTKLQWQPVAGAVSYEVKRASTSNGSYTSIASNVTDTAYTDTTAQNGTTYFYVVQDVNSSNIHSVNSNEVAVTPQKKYDLNVQISASSYDGIRDQDPATGNKENNVKDDLTTRWGATGKGQWLQFDLGGVSSIGFAGIAFYKGDERSYFFEVQTSNDLVTWNKIYEGRSSGATLSMENFDLPDTDARYVRIIGKGNTATDYNGYTVVHLYSSNPGGMVNSAYSQGTPVTPDTAIRPTKPGLYNPDGTVHVMPDPNKVTGRTLNVKDTAFGAKGDGVSDDRAAIQRAVDAALPGDEVYLPNGIYKLITLTDASSQIKLKTGVNFRGESREGTVLLSDIASTVGSSRVLLATSINDVVISNFTITSTWNDKYPTDPVLPSTTKGGPKNGIYIDQAGTSAGPKNIVVDNLIFEKFEQMGIRLSKASDVVVKNSIFRKATDIGPSGAGYGISIQGKPKDDHFGKNDDSLYTLVENNIFDGTDALRHGVIIQYYSHNNVVRNNQFINTTLDAIDLHGEYEYLNEVYGNTAVGIKRGAGVGLGNTGGGAPSNHAESGYGNYIHDNIIRNSAEGISVTMGSPDTIIEQNTIELDNTLVRTEYNQEIVGFSLLNSPRTIVKNNVFRNFTAKDWPIVADYDLGDKNANFVGAGDPKDIQLIGNTIVGNANGIKIQKGSGILAQNNNLNNTINNMVNFSGNVVYDSLSYSTEDAWVDAVNPQQNNGVGLSDKVKNMTVKSTISNNSLGIAYLKYDLSGMSTVNHVALQLSGKLTDINPGDESVTLSVYGLTDSSWSESGINWSNSPNHNPNNSEVVGSGATAFFLGSFTMQGYKVGSYDVATKELTDFVNSQVGGKATFMIVDTQKQGVNVELYSREKELESLRPALKLSSIEPNNANLSGLKIMEGTSTFDPTPAFAADKTVYTLNVASWVSSLVINATSLSNRAMIKINNNVQASGTDVKIDYLKPGANTITVEVTAEDGITKKTYQINLIRMFYDNNSNSTGSSSGGTTTSPTQGEQSNNNNQATPINAEVKNVGGKSVAQAKVDDKLIDTALKASINGKIKLAVETSVKADQINVSLNSAALQKIVTDGQVKSLTVETKLGNYELPVKQINLQDLAAKLGVAKENVSLDIGISKNNTAVEVAKTSGQKVIGAVEFIVKATSPDGKSIEISTFTQYVPRTIKTEESFNAHNLAAVRVETDNQGTTTYQPVPFMVSGTEVTLYSRTNSTYLLLENNATFADIKNHWAKDEIEGMANKFIVQGISKDEFRPEQAVTRAEFAALITRTIGLKSAASSKIKFNDVRSSDWFEGQAYAATEAGIVTGYDDQTFRPNQPISRQEMAVMIYRAMKFAGYDEANTGQKVTFTDENLFENWAKEAISVMADKKIVEGVDSGKYDPAATATRAQSSVILSRMLSKVNFTQ